MNDHDNTLLGIFWAICLDGPTQILARWEPFAKVPEIGGFRTIETGHIDHWAALQDQDPRLRGIEYEEFPRGRVNYRREDDRFLLLADRSLLYPRFIAAICDQARLPRARTQVLSDPHYRSRRRVKRLEPAAPPAAG